MSPILELMGTLFVVATPIGNLEDTTLRALRVLREVDLIAAEDIRRTRILLNHYGINTPTISYHRFSEKSKLSMIIEKLQSSDVALVSDAGTPGLADPGQVLIKEAIAQDIPVTVIPGPSSAVSALVASGLSTESFLFLAFLPRKSGERQRLLRSVKDTPWTLVFFESPYRITKRLEEIKEILGDRNIALAHELTKIHEYVLRGKIGEVLDSLKSKALKGEFTLVIQGAESPPRKSSARK